MSAQLVPVNEIKHAQIAEMPLVTIASNQLGWDNVYLLLEIPNRLAYDLGHIANQEANVSLKEDDKIGTSYIFDLEDSTKVTLDSPNQDSKIVNIQLPVSRDKTATTKNISAEPINDPVGQPYYKSPFVYLQRDPSVGNTIHFAALVPLSATLTLSLSTNKFTLLVTEIPGGLPGFHLYQTSISTDHVPGAVDLEFAVKKGSGGEKSVIVNISTGDVGTGGSKN